MADNRVVFRNWKVETAQADAQDDEPTADIGSAAEPAAPDPMLEPPDPLGQARADRIARAVRHAIALLHPEEQELIIRYHFQGISFHEMSDLTGRPVHKLVGLHMQAFRHLRITLRRLANREYRTRRSIGETCPICRSPHRAAIDTIIFARDRRGTWSPVLRALAEQYNLKLRAPQILIGHEKYHKGDLS